MYYSRMPKTVLSRKLIAAREEMGLNLNQAVAMMPHTSYQTMYVLEGRNRQRKACPGDRLEFKTVLDIVDCYWPRIQVKDLQPDAGHLSFVKSRV